MNESEKLAYNLGLTTQEIRFCESYATHGVGAKAAREAGYSPSPNSCTSRAYILLKRPEIRQHISYLEKETLAEIGATRIEIAKHYLKIVRRASEGLDIGDMVKVDKNSLDAADKLAKLCGLNSPEKTSTAIEIMASEGVDTDTADWIAHEVLGVPRDHGKVESDE